MNLDFMLQQLTDNAQRIRALVENLPAAQAHWRPDAETWSVMEVLNHLADEERLDFRVRIDYTLYRPGEAAPPIDPAGWVTQRAYNQRDLQPSLADFLAERQRSLAWLGSLQNPNWEASFQAPWGEMRAGDFLAGWIAHDLLHMRQLVELLWAYSVQQSQPYSVQYGGEW